ncbi:MAG: hypothetical protein ACQEXQ_22495 [Bacillota bacterium]
MWIIIGIFFLLFFFIAVYGISLMAVKDSDLSKSVENLNLEVASLKDELASLKASIKTKE